MKVHDLLSELASEKRLGILYALSVSSMNFTKISNELGMTSPEASRQLSRLIEAGLIKKKVDGAYHITPFGKLTLLCISNLRFISEKSGYFSNHDTSPIPSHLLRRIDALSNGEIVTGVYEILYTLDEHFEGVRKYLWFIADDLPRYILPKCEKKLDEGVKFKAILPKSLLSNLLPIMPKKIREEVKFRVLDEIKIAMDASDSFAALGLPGQDGKIDYSAIIFGFDSMFQEWCREVFEYYWEKAKPYLI